MKYYNHIEELIFRHFQGESTPDEAKYLEEWKNLSEENHRTFSEIEELADYREFMRDADRYDPAKVFPNFKRRLHLYRKNRKRLRYTVAAAISILVSIGFYYTTNEWGDTNIISQTVIMPGESKALLYLSDGRVIDLKEIPDAAIIDEISEEIRNEHGSILNYNKEGKTDASVNTVYHKIVIPRGGEYCIVLADGTKVWLNSETTLEYPLSFVGERREVRLSGEAFFDVARDMSRPFHVITAHNSIEVTGTSFSVSSYPDESKTTAALESGSIIFRTLSGEFPMRPGEYAEYDINTRKTIISDVDIKNNTNWRYGTLYFDDIPLSEIMNKLARWYDVEFRFADKSLAQIHFSGAAERNKPLNHILTLLENTRDLKFTSVDGKVIIISQK